MWATHVVALAALACLLLAWAGVQAAWRRSFRPAEPDADALAGRMRCHDLRCAGSCRAAGECPAQEETP